MGRDDDLINELLKEREYLLNKNPALKPYKKELDKILTDIGDDPESRLTKISEIMNDIMENEFKPEMKKLEDLLKKDEKKRRAG